jgi:hypothetical protein
VEDVGEQFKELGLKHSIVRMVVLASKGGALEQQTCKIPMRGDLRAENVAKLAIDDLLEFSNMWQKRIRRHSSM